MAEEINVQGTENTALEQEKTFTQADVDKMIQTRLDRERKKYPSEEEITAYRTWKDGQQTEQERQAKRDKYVLSKGLTDDDAEFIAFKALKMVDDKTTFEQAVDKLTENRQKVKFDWTAPAGNGEKPNATNAAMNNLIRGALK